MPVEQREFPTLGLSTAACQRPSPSGGALQSIYSGRTFHPSQPAIPPAATGQTPNSGACCSNDFQRNRTAVDRLGERQKQATEAAWQTIANLLPPPARLGRPLVSHHTLLQAILWVVRFGAAWHAIPASFAPWQTVYTRYKQWLKSGLWSKIVLILTSQTPVVM